MKRILRVVHATRAPQPLAIPERPRPKAPRPWPMLSAPIDALETVLRSRAQSALTGFVFRDGSRVCDVPCIEHARDVLAWYRPK